MRLYRGFDMMSRKRLYLLLLGLLGTCAALAPKYQNSGVNSHIPHGALPFGQYVQGVIGDIRESRRLAGLPHDEKTVLGNAPYECVPGGLCPDFNPDRANEGMYENGILLVHGYSDSPYLMRDLARFFASRGFLVRSVILPGHGGVPGDLLDVTYEDWLTTVRYGVASFRGRVKKLHAAGYSTGGTLLTRLVLARELDLQSLYLYSPALGLNSSLGFMADWHKIVSWAAPGAAWWNLEDDDDAIKYESTPMNGAYQVYLLMREVSALRNAGRRLDIPFFTVQSETDNTVSVEATLSFFREQRTPGSRLIFYTDIGEIREEGDTVFVPYSLPEKGILTYSHVSITMSPSDGHYGENADYHNCRHYQKRDPGKHAACKRGEGEIRYGEVLEEHAQRYVLRRLTHNPRFDHMTGEMGRFIEEQTR